jgi:hypothetical protein
MRLLGFDDNDVMQYVTIEELTALLGDEPAPETPPPLPVPTTKQPGVLWGGGGELFWFGANPGAAMEYTGMTREIVKANGIRRMAATGAGAWCVEGEGGRVYPPAIQECANFFDEVYVGMYLAAYPFPMSNAEVDTLVNNFISLLRVAAQNGASGASADCEVYEAPDQGLWSQMPRAVAERYGTMIGKAIRSVGWTKLLLYPSSEASFPGSYNDLANEANGRTGTYANNKFQYFVKKVMDEGVEVTHTDAVFHWGPQVSGYDWSTGAAETAKRCKAFDPRLKGNIMFWPDNTEAAHFRPTEGYPPGMTFDAAHGAANNGTGEFTVYHGDAFFDHQEKWPNLWFPEIKTGIG